MKRTWTLTLAFALLVVGASAAAAGSVTGSAALALAGVVAPHSSSLSAADKRAVAAFFAGKVGAGCKTKISVTADKIVCRTSNVDITARSCQLTFRKDMVSLSGREANELYATETVAGVTAEGAAGSNVESLSKLSCTLDPAELKDKAGAGASCSYEPAE
jgi:hypothetical protein